MHTTLKQYHVYPHLLYMRLWIDQVKACVNNMGNGCIWIMLGGTHPLVYHHHYIIIRWLAVCNLLLCWSHLFQARDLISPVARLLASNLVLGQICKTLPLFKKMQHAVKTKCGCLLWKARDWKRNKQNRSGSCMVEGGISIGHHHSWVMGNHMYIDKNENFLDDTDPLSDLANFLHFIHPLASLFSEIINIYDLKRWWMKTKMCMFSFVLFGIWLHYEDYISMLTFLWG